MTNFILHKSSFYLRFDSADATGVAKLFKGVRKDRTDALLESLQAFGHAHEVENGRYLA